MLGPNINRKWHRKPPVGAQIRRGHPLTHGLVAGYVFNEAGGKTCHDITQVHNLRLDLTGLGWSTKNGVANVDLTNNSAALMYFGNTIGALALNGTFTIAFHFTPTAVSANQSILLSNDSSARVMALGIWGATNKVFITEQNQAVIGSTTSTIAAGQRVHIAWTFDSANNNRLYYDGRLDATFNRAFGSPVTAQYYIGSPNLANAPANFVLENFYVYNRALAANEVSRLSQEPYSFLGSTPLSSHGFTPTVAPPAPASTGFSLLGVG